MHINLFEASQLFTHSIGMPRLLFLRNYLAVRKNNVTCLVNKILLLVNWAARVKKATWHSLAEIKQDYASVDYVGNDRYVFNIHGNQFRLVVLIFMVRQKVYVRWVGRHKDYDKIDCKTI